MNKSKEENDFVSLKQLKKTLLLIAVLALFSISEVSHAQESPPVTSTDVNREIGGLGVSVQDVPSAFIEQSGIKQPAGALVADVTDRGPAAVAGIRKGDIIIAIAGQEISDSLTLRNEIDKAKPGSRVQVEFIREGERKEVIVTVGVGRPQVFSEIDALTQHLVIMDILAFGEWDEFLQLPALKLSFVIVDRREPAYTVFEGVPENLPRDEFEEIKASIAQNVEMVPWDKFERNADSYVKTRMVRN